MGDYHVFANACDFGTIAAENAQDARDQASVLAGYKSETDLCQQLGCVYSDITALLIENRAG